jgi:hypothetical protein
MSSTLQKVGDWFGGFFLPKKPAMNVEGIHYTYVRNIEKNRAITIASVVSDNLDDENSSKYKIQFSWAFLSNHDRFVKREARQIVNDRLLHNTDNKYKRVLYANEKIHDIIKYRILCVILNDLGTPQKYCEEIFYEIEHLMDTR